MSCSCQSRIHVWKRKSAGRSFHGMEADYIPVRMSGGAGMLFYPGCWQPHLGSMEQEKATKGVLPLEAIVTIRA